MGDLLGAPAVRRDPPEAALVKPHRPADLAGHAVYDLRPTDRRAILEEAAGITKFKTKKRLAEARLEESKQNLARVHDIFEELTRHKPTRLADLLAAERAALLQAAS